MPDSTPPLRFTATPHRHVIARESTVFRLHHRARGAGGFKPGPTDANAHGGRFDGTVEDPFPSYYAGLSVTTALAEVLLRNVGPGDDGLRLIRRPKIAGIRLSAVRTTRELSLVSLLTGPALAAVAQDSWLVHEEGEQAYQKTRRWASWIRGQAPWADGLIWDSKRDTGKPALVLFGDRCAADALDGDEPEFHIDLDTPIGEAWLSRMLVPYHAAVAPAVS